MDIEYSVSKTDNRVQMCCTKSKDFERPKPLGFKIQSQKLPWKNEDDEELTAPLLCLTDEKMPESRKKLTTRENAGMTVLSQLINSDMAVDPPDEIKNKFAGFKIDRKIVLVSDWKKAFLSAISSDFEHVTDDKRAQNERQAVKRTRDSLCDKNAIVVWGDYIWHYTPELPVNTGVAVDFAKTLPATVTERDKA